MKRFLGVIFCVLLLVIAISTSGFAQASATVNYRMPSVTENTGNIIRYVAATADTITKANIKFLVAFAVTWPKASDTVEVKNGTTTIAKCAWGSTPPAPFLLRLETTMTDTLFVTTKQSSGVAMTYRKLW